MSNDIGALIIDNDETHANEVQGILNTWDIQDVTVVKHIKQVGEELEKVLGTYNNVVIVLDDEKDSTDESLEARDKLFLNVFFQIMKTVQYKKILILSNADSHEYNKSMTCMNTYFDHLGSTSRVTCIATDKIPAKITNALSSLKPNDSSQSELA